MTIQLQDICKSVSGKEILKNINWEIGSDDCFLLMGPALSGKTMLLRLILGQCRCRVPGGPAVRAVFGGRERGYGECTSVRDSCGRGA